MSGFSCREGFEEPAAAFLIVNFLREDVGAQPLAAYLLQEVCLSNFASGSRSRKAEDQRTANDKRDAVIRHDIEKERARSLAKTARLRALRLEKEAAEEAEADKQPVPVKKEAKRRTTRAPGH